MKKLLPILFLLAHFSIIVAQEKLIDKFPQDNGKVTYTNVISVDSSIKKDLYVKAKRWFVNTYNSGKDVIQIDDKENGEIIGKGYFQEYMKVALGGHNVSVWHTIRVQSKDGRYKYTINNIILKEEIPGNNSEYSIEEFCNFRRDKQLVKLMEDINARFNQLILSLNTNMKKTNHDIW